VSAYKALRENLLLSRMILTSGPMTRSEGTVP
jgi:hypothetical protein